LTHDWDGATQLRLTRPHIAYSLSNTILPAGRVVTSAISFERVKFPIDLCISMLERIKSMFGSKPSVSETDSKFSEYSLYEIGESMCRYHPDGMPGFQRTNAKQWDGYSMGVVLERRQRDVALRPDMIRDLDRLLEESVDDSDRYLEYVEMDEPRITESNVEQFREQFFEQYSQDEIMETLKELYHEQYEANVALDKLVGSTETDGYSFTYRTNGFDRTSVTMDGESAGMETMSLREKSVEMRNVAGQLHLCESNITSVIDELIQCELELLLDKIDVSDESGGLESEEDVIQSALEARERIRDMGGVPDVVVFDTDEDWHGNIGVAVHSDNTGVMDVPFIVSDSGCGLRVTADSVSVSRPYGFRREHVYRLTWVGNYAIIDSDAVQGPA
jgi:hypothetical protein